MVQMEARRPQAISNPQPLSPDRRSIMVSTRQRIWQWSRIAATAVPCCIILAAAGVAVVIINFEGSNAEMRRGTSSLDGWFSLALGVIYALLAIAFRSYVQPLIVLVAIPFGVVGAMLGHILLGYDLSLISLMGMIALSGVVVNDSLIMIDYANRRRGDESACEAILQSGVRRFRPIMLTTLTTFGGLMPIIFETSLQAQYIIPMAISLGFGILFSTAIILVLVPCIYVIVEDVKRAFGSS